jgi:hypothetical protein
MRRLAVPEGHTWKLISAFKLGTCKNYPKIAYGSVRAGQVLVKLHLAPTLDPRASPIDPEQGA